MRSCVHNSTGFAAILVALFVAACSSPRAKIPPAIEITHTPASRPGGPDKLEPISGRVIGAEPGQKIVLYAKSGVWWIQPFANNPFTEIRQDATWQNTTHLGTEYAAVLVSPGYLPPKKTPALPHVGDGVIGVTAVAGAKPEANGEPAPKRLQFSGYEWDVRQTPSDRGGAMHNYSAANAWVDEMGWLHVRISRQGDNWMSAEVNLLRSLGYGTYSFVVREMTPLEPATVLGMFTWDDEEAGQNHREIDIELSQWGDPAVKNAQFVVQPYYVPANSFRFIAPPFALTHAFRWEPGRVSFQTSHGTVPGRARVVAEHVFTSGIPSPGGESIHINLTVYGKSRMPQKREVEVVFEKFEFLP